VQAALVILGDLSIQGNIKPIRSLAEPLQVAMDTRCLLGHQSIGQRSGRVLPVG
jgi:hypothetical protein